MAFIDEMSQGLTKMGQTVIDKAKGDTESVRITSAIRDEQSKQNNLFQQIGVYFYQNFSGQAQGDMRKWCDEVAESQRQVQQYQEQLMIIKGGNHCPNCNAPVSVTAAFCTNCGSRLLKPQEQQNISYDASAGQNAEPQPEARQEVPAQEQEDTHQNVCPACGAPFEEGQAFCTNCGKKLG